MPEIGRIQSTNFQSLLTELGITRNNIPFALRSEVTPVVLVGGTVSFVASPTPAYAVTDIFTIGVSVAPIIATVLADTGPLPIGAYTMTLVLNADEAAFYEIAWRNAANTANLWVQELNNMLGAAGGPSSVQMIVRLNVENDNERFRVLNVVAGGVGARYQASIMAKV